MKNWDIQYIKHLKAKCNILLKTASDKDKVNIKKTLWTLNEIEKYYYKKFNFSLPQKTNYYKILLDDLDSLKKFGYYMPIVRKANILGKKLNIKGETLARIKVSDAKLMEAADLFYQQFNGEFNLAYQKVQKGFEKRLRINKYRKVADGLTFSVYNTKISFLEVQREQTIQDFLTINHEIAHSIVNYINKRSIWDVEKYPFIEVESLFFETLTNYQLLENEATSTEALYLAFDIIKDYLTETKLICLKANMYNDYSFKELIDKKKIKKYLKRKCKLENLKPKTILATKITDNFHYIVSYFTAIEIFLIYRQDPQKALESLIAITKASGKTEGEYLSYVNSLGINPGENFQQYLELLKSFDKKENIYGKIRYKTKRFKR